MDVEPGARYAARDMRLLRRRIRGYFALQAIVLLAALGASLLFKFRTDVVFTPLDHAAWRFAYVGLLAVYVKAWWTTRKPSLYRNLWAVAASCISLGGGLYFFWQGHGSLGQACRGMVTILIGGLGLYLYCQGGDRGTHEAITTTANQPCET